ncbi:hypothetical protein FBU30_009837, partial [Linnemannia zychae]
MTTIQDHDSLLFKDDYNSPEQSPTNDDDSTPGHGDTTDDEPFVLRKNIQNSLQYANSIQLSCSIHEGSCICAPGPSSGTLTLIQAKRTKSKATDETDEILLDAIDSLDPLSKSRKEIAECWGKVAESCRIRGSSALKNTEKAAHFDDATGKSVRQRWMQLRKDLDKAKAARTKRPTGTVQADLSEKLRMVETLIDREERQKTRNRHIKQQENEKRKQNYMTGKMMTGLSMSTRRDLHNASVLSDSTDSDITAENSQQYTRSPLSSFYGRSVNPLSSNAGLISTLQQRMAEFESMIVEMREQDR